MTAGTPVLSPEGINTLITGTEAATLCGVTTAAVRQWVTRGHLAVKGIDAKGRNVYRLLDVAKAERATRDHPAAAIRR